MSKISEILVVSQGFERNISNFTINDFKTEKLPNFPELENTQFKKFYRIEEFEPGSRCRWGYSRWITGDNSKLKMLDNNWDSSG